jgi:RNA polymerase sigma-70 factor (ECF subfamily)
MEQFAKTYWYPIYAFIRRKGQEPAAAEDLTQGFFQDLLATEWMANVERREGRFSTLLLTILNRYLIDHYRRETGIKRGGGTESLSIDMAQGEHWYGCEPTANETPESIFERRYACSVLQRAIECLGIEMRSSGRGRNFDLLSPYLSREPAKGEYATAAAALSISQNGVAVAVRRLRQEYRGFIRAEVAGSLLNEAQVNDELRHLLLAVSSAPLQDG